MAWTSPRTWVAGETVTASLLNTHIKDNLKAIGDGWTSWSTSWTSGSGGTVISIGNGTLTSVYMQAGKLVHFRILVVRGSTTNLGTTGYVWTLPVSMTTFRNTGPAHVLDSSASTITPHAWHGLSSSEIVVHASSSRRIDNNGFGTTPTAWATSDEIVICGTYEAA